MLGTYLGCQSDLQASQDLHYLITSVDNYICLHIHVSYFPVKTGPHGVQLISCCKMRRKIGGRRKKRFLLNRVPQQIWLSPNLPSFKLCSAKPLYWKRHVPNNSQVECKWIFQQLTLFEQTRLKEQEEKDLPSRSTFDIFFIAKNALMFS